tara:strand:+ start:118 stop:495 length:378 start_codon:yes stop_codon:yes gene_type:complete
MGCSEFDFQVSTCTQVDIGFDFDKVLTYKDSLGVAIPLSSLEFSMTIKQSLGGTTLLSLVEVANNISTGLYIPAPSTGVINIQITDADTLLVDEGIYPYEIKVVDADAKVEIFMQGTIQFHSRGF